VIFTTSYEEQKKWRSAFKHIKIVSSEDGSLQDAYFLSSSEKKPLLVSLHTWSGDYSQADPLAELALKYNWNYIHPNFRGPNWTKGACLSSLVTTDIDDAIGYAFNNATVDYKNIFIVGVSGGGYATLGSYLKTKHDIKAFLSWVPISNLTDWYYQSKSMLNEEYANNILACTSSIDEGKLDDISSKKRSPIYWDVPTRSNGLLEIYAGINDGHTGEGSVPISHSLLFFNHIVSALGESESRIDSSTIINLLTRAFKGNYNYKKIDNRAVIYQKKSRNISITIFDGGHEMLPNHTFKRLIEISKQN